MELQSKKGKRKDLSDFSGKASKPKDKSDFAGKNKGPKDKSDFATNKKPVTKSSVTKSSSNKTGGNKTKPKVVTPAMIKAKGFTSLRDYLNNERGLKRRDGKKVEKTTKTTKTSKVVQPPKKVTDYDKKVRDYRGANKIVPSLKTSSAGIDGGSSQVNKVKSKAAKKKSSFFDSIGSGIKKAVKETKRNFEGDFKKKTGRYKLISKGKSNIVGNKNFVSDKKKKKKLPKQISV